VRTGGEMVEALQVIARLRTEAAAVGVTGHRQYNNGWHTALDLANMLDVSEAITRAALLRQESRGAQFREDFPTQDEEWGRHNIVVRRATDGGMTVEKRPLPPMPHEIEEIIKEMK
jgi:succinate dehydrogenase / fumarate reductase, flavoprotein subunit